MRALAVVAALVLMLSGPLMLSSCGVERLAVPAPSPTTTSPRSPATLDLVSRRLAAVKGTVVTTPVRVKPGRATLVGTVLGPGGPVAGATVRAERLVGGRGATITAVTSVGGTWSITGVAGGRWKLRAWKAPEWAQPSPVAVFVGAASTENLTLLLESVANPLVQATFSPAAAVLGRPVRVTVKVHSSVVEANGAVVPRARGGAVVGLSGGNGWKVEGPDPATASPRGIASFIAVCDKAGQHPLEASVFGGAPSALSAPPCVASK